MRLRTKILLILAAFLVLYFGTVYLVRRLAIDPTLTRFEQGYALQDAERAHHALGMEVERLHALVSDWRMWDAVRDGAAGRDPSFPDRRMGLDLRQEFRIDIIRIVAPDGALRWARSEHHRTGELIESPDISVPDAGQPAAGLWISDAGILAVATAPVAPIDADGSSPGTLLIGRVLDEASMQQLSDVSGIRLRIYPADHAPPIDPRSILPTPEAMTATGVRFFEFEDGELGTRIPADDMLGRPALILETRMDRAIHVIGLRTGRILVLSLVALGVLAGIALLIALALLVTRPVDRLVKHLLVIRAGDYLTARLPFRSRDEIGQLADEFNSMLGRLQEDHERRLEAEQALRDSESRYRRLAIHDDLTGLYNTRFLYESLERLLARCEQNDEPFSLLFIDIDRFKQVVDTYGHLHGSQAIAEVARVLTEHLEEPCYGVSYGGDEYVLVLPGYDKAAALGKAEELRARIADHVFLTERDLRVRLTISLGVANYPEDARDMAGVLALADAALFYVKGRGRNSVGESPPGTGS